MSGFKVADLSVVISIFMRGKTMISKRLAGIGVLIFALVMGCAGNYGPYYSTGVQEIWGPDNQLYGYVVYQQYAVSLQRVKQIDENTIRISWSPPRGEGGGR